MSVLTKRLTLAECEVACDVVAGFLYAINRDIQDLDLIKCEEHLDELSDWLNNRKEN